jgi:hypothetical protein
VEDEAVDPIAQSPLSIIRQRVLDTITKSDEESRGYQDTLNRIEEAKQRLLAAPDKRQMLQGLVGKLTATRSQDDPRFFERQNLYTFLRDVGEYGQEQKAAEKEREAKRIMLQEMQAKYGMEMAEKRRGRAEQLAVQYLSKEPKETETPANLRETQYYQNVVKNPTKFSPDEVQYAQDWLKKSVRIPDDGKDKTGFSPAEIRSIGMEVRAQTDSPKEKVNFANDALGKLKLAIEGNPQAEVQVDRSLATLAGDKQLSLAEVQTITGAGSFAQRVANSINKFFTGGAGDLTNEQKKELLEFYEEYYGKSFNNARERVKRIYSGPGYEGLPEDIFGSRYVSIRERREKAARDAEAAAQDESGAIVVNGKKGRLVN